jgi:hypothetical protein
MRIVGLFDLQVVEGVLGYFVASALIMPFATLVHELGHALFALRFSNEPVLVQVGRPPAMVTLVGERLKVGWSMLPSRNVGFSGLTVWDDSESTDLEHVVVALAGPLATALLIPLFIWASIVSIGSPYLLTATLVGAVANCVLSVFVSLNPWSRRGPGGHSSDGRHAVRTYRAWRGP